MMRKHLQIGVVKGAITQEVADAKLADWKKAKEAKIASKHEDVSKTKLAAAKARKAAETKVREARAEAIRKKAEVAAAAPAAPAEGEAAAAPAEEQA
jgi:small subunit ribosomal protein S16